MTQENPPVITTVRLSMPLNLGSVNCYLLKTTAGFLLIDTGMPSRRADLEEGLQRAGCRPGNLQLIVLTHGDFDHTGSAAYLRRKYGAKIAMHPGDSGMAEQADMFWNRGKSNALLRAIIPTLFGFTRADRFIPDFLIEEGYDLSGFGLKACVIEFPGHSRGSVGILTETGDLFCGDLLMHDRSQPALGFGKPEAFKWSIDRLKSLPVATIYPGHGSPFSLEQVKIHFL